MLDFSNYFTFPQIIGYIALSFTLSAFLSKNDIKLKRLATTGTAIWAYHYYLMGSIASAWICVLIAIRQGSAIQTQTYSKKTLSYMTGFWILVFSSMLIFTWQDLSSLLPYGAAVNATFAWLYLSGITFRKQVLLSDFFWLLNGFWWMSYGQIGTSAFALLFNLYTIYQMTKIEQAKRMQANSI